MKETALAHITYDGGRVDVGLKCVLTVEFDRILHFEGFYPFYRAINSLGVRTLILNVLFYPAHNASEICKHSHVLKYFDGAWHFVEPFCSPKKLQLSTFKVYAKQLVDAAIQFQLFAFSDIPKSKKPAKLGDSDEEY